LARKGVHRQHILDAAGHLFKTQGFHATGMNEIVARSKAPKGSLYHYFPRGKEQLATEAIQESGRETQALMQAAIAEHPDPGAALEAAVLALAHQLQDSDFANGCPLATVALEASHTSENIRKACMDGYERWLQMLQTPIVEQGVPADVARDMACFALSAIEGALLLSRVQRSIKPLETAARTLRMMAGLMQAVGSAEQLGRSSKS
jgi:TetR/AcrR family transcriptional repressor of lmrAB and yxaGH operons